VVNAGAPHALHVNAGGAGASLTAYASPTTLANTAAATGAAIGDVDGDGFRDVVVAVNGGPAQVFRNNGFTTSGETTSWAELAAATPVAAASATANAVALADVDGDGRHDVVLATTAGVLLHLNRGAGVAGDWQGFRSAATLSPTAGTALALARLDADTDLDILLGTAAGVQVLSGTPASTSTLAFSQVTVSLTDGVKGPLSITDGQGAFLLLPGAAPVGGIVGTFSGSISATAGGLDAGARVSVRYNGTTTAVDETITVGGVAIPLVFTAGQVATVTAPYVQVAVSGALKLGDFVEIAGTIAFDSGGGEITVTNLVVFVGQGPGFLADQSINPLAKGLFLTGVNGSIKGSNAGTRVVALSGAVALVGIPGVTLSGTAWVYYNETLTEQVLGSGDDAITIAEGTATAPHILVIGDLDLGIVGQTLNGTFAVETLVGGGLRLKFGTAARDGGTPLTLSLGDGVAVATVASGELELTPAGVATVLTATLTLNAGDAFTLEGDIALQLNTALVAKTVQGIVLPASSVRVQVGTLVTPAVLTIGTQALSGVFVFSQVRGTLAPGAPAGTTPPSTTVLMASALTLTLGTATAGVQLTDGAAVFVMTAAGVAGRVTGTLRILVPGDAVQFSGTFTVAVNSGAEVKQTFQLDGTSVVLALPVGPYLRVEGTNVAIVVAGQRLSGNFTVTAAGATTTITIANARAAFGDGTAELVALTGGTGSFTLTTAGIVGSVSGTVTVTLPGVSVGGNFTVSLDTTVAGIPTLRVVGAGITLDIGGFVLTGAVTFSQSSVGGVKIVDVAATVSANFGAPIGTINLAGALQIGPGGLAGVLTITSPSISLGGAVAVTATSLRLEINRSTQAVVLADGVTRLEAGPYLRLAGTNVALVLGDVTLTASLLFQQATNTAGQSRTVIAVSGGSVALGSTTILTGVEGLVVLVPAGMAMSLAGTLNLGSLLPAGVTIAGSFALAMNQSTVRVTETVTVGGRTVSLDLAAGQYIRVGGTGITLAIAGQSLTGDIAFQRSAGVTSIVLANVSASLGDGALTLTGGSGSFALTTGPTRMQGTVSGTVGLNVPGVSASALMQLAVDTSPSTFSISVTGLTLDIAGQKLTGNFTFEQAGVGAARVVKVSATNVSLFLGDPKG
ncbi:MAG: VCBS repeat-containing protein, partial [Cellulomonas sp.]|nr:VCBS repeat-containing protein [Cellulomonas sp.]